MRAKKSQLVNDSGYWERVVQRGLELEKEDLRETAAPEGLAAQLAKTCAALPAIQTVPVRHWIHAMVAAALLLAFAFLWRTTRPAATPGEKSFGSMTKIIKPVVAANPKPAIQTASKRNAPGSRLAVARQRTRLHPRQIMHRRSVKNELAAAQLPEQAVFPTPTPPTREEKLLLALMFSHPSAMIITQLQPPSPPRWLKPVLSPSNSPFKLDQYSISATPNFR